jgi:hypothetical protein
MPGILGTERRVEREKKGGHGKRLITNIDESVVGGESSRTWTIVGTVLNRIN